jgi:hypothetical protein
VACDRGRTATRGLKNPGLFIDSACLCERPASLLVRGDSTPADELQGNM